MTKKEKFELIGRCIDRYTAKQPLPYDRISAFMDLEYSKVNVKELAETDGTTFFHDMNGIFAHMDREKKELGDCFVPRVGLIKEEN